MNKLLFSFILIFLALFAYLLFWPTPIAPLSYSPPAAPELTGPLRPNTELRNAVFIGAGALNGPEDMAVDPLGRVYTSSHDGIIQRINRDGSVETFAVTGGHPLGMMFESENLIVADAFKGLLSIDPDGIITVLTTESEDIPFSFTNDLDISESGLIYFSDASSQYTQPEYHYDLLEARPHGRLLKYDPKTGETTTLMDGLFFANGVALSQNEDFLLVNETYRYRIQRYWLTGPNAGNSEIFWDNLPGFPDNISSTDDGRFWLALFTVRNPLMDRLHQSAFLKKVLSRLPAFLWLNPAPYGFVIELDESGNILRTLQDPGGEKISIVTSVKQIDNLLYLGNLYSDRMGVLNLEDLDEG